MQKRKISTLKVQSSKNKITNDYDLLDNLPKDICFGVLDNPYESLVIVDANGIVLFLSSSWEEIYKMKAEEAIGRYIGDLNSDTRLPVVLKTGIAEIGRSALINSQNRIVLRIPIMKSGVIIGAFGKRIFILPENLKELTNRIITLESHVDYYKKELYQTNRSRYCFDNIIGRSELIRCAKERAAKAAKSNLPILLMGESGTGKELFAQAIHLASFQGENAFVSVNCAGIPNELIESELFGYEAGSFTGANPKGKIGKFQLAENGTIFLDEIGDMPIHMQAKLLRVLQEKKVEKIGAHESKHVNFRLITATNRNLEEMVQRNTFRLDLYHRINVFVIALPTLRTIKEDIPLYAQHFLSEMKRLNTNNVNSISEDALKILQGYHWPGNLRELKNIIQQAFILCESTQIKVSDLPPAFRKIFVPSVLTNENIPLLKDIIQKTEIQIISKALEITGNNKRSAANLLGINRCGLYNKLKKYGMEV